MPAIYKTPYQKIFANKEELNKFLLKLVSLLTYKQISVPNVLRLPYFYSDFSYSNNEIESFTKFIKIYTKQEIIDALNPDTNIKELNDIKGLESTKLQSGLDGKQLLSYFNLRILIGFLTNDITNLYTELTEMPSGRTFLQNSSIPLSNEIPSEKFVFCYFNLWPYEKTWKMTISKGSPDYYKYNIMAQDLISDYFQYNIYVPKKDYKES